MKLKRLTQLRIGFLIIGAIVVFVGLVFRLYYLQIVMGPTLVQKTERSRTYHLPIPPTRGLIFDRNGHPLAQNAISYTVKLGKHANVDIEQSLYRLNAFLKMSPDTLERHLNALRSDSIVAREIQKNLPEDLKEEIETAQIPGVSFDKKSIRFYPEGTLAANLIGSVGSDNTGLEGLEYSLNDRLKGKGEVILADKDILKNLIAEDDYTKIITRGADFVLTLDSYIQFIVERELKKVCEETGAIQASAVVMNPHNGEILALANYPTYDPNRYADYTPETRKNRAVGNIFEPGSVMKPFILTAALDQGVVKPDDVFYCEKGYYYFKGRTIRDDIHSFDYLTVHDILVRSSNIGFIKIARRLGKDEDDYKGQAQILYDYLRRFGFKHHGEKTTDEIPGENSGILRRPESWLPSTIGSIPFGHEMSTNTLTLTAAYTALANRGLYYKPHIIRGFRGRDGVFRSRETAEPYRIVPEPVVEQVVRMMVDVTEDPEGTGRRVKIPGFRTAGKTGTAQKVDPDTGRYGKGMRYASFGGFLPADNPQMVIVVVVDEPKKKKYGGEVAGPVFKAIAEEIIAYWGLSPTHPEDMLLAHTKAPGKKTKPAEPIDNPFRVSKQLPIRSIPTWMDGNGTMPNLVGLPIREAYIQLVINGIQATFEGTGKVVSQPVPPGAPIAENHIGTIVCEPVLTDPEIQIGADLLVQR